MIRYDLVVTDELYVQSCCFLWEDILFFSLYSFSCIAKQHTTLNHFRILSCVTFLDMNFRSICPVPALHHCDQYHLHPTPPITLSANLSDALRAVLATGLGDRPAVQVWTGKTVLFCSRPVQEPNPLRLGGPNQCLYLSTFGFCRVSLDPSVPIAGSCSRVFLFMAASRYPAAVYQIFTSVHYCLCLMYWPPLKSKKRETHSLPHPENELQQSVHDLRSCIMGKIRSTGQLH